MGWFVACTGAAWSIVLSIMMCTGRWAWSWAMSLMVVSTVSSAGVRVDVDDLVLGGSEAIISKEIL